MVDEGGFSKGADDNLTVEPLLRRDTVHTNGFLDACLSAWKEHHSLALKPQHLLLAILQQFAIHVNEHSEELRSSFVDFKGKKNYVSAATNLLWDSQTIGKNVYPHSCPKCKRLFRKKRCVQ